MNSILDTIKTMLGPTAEDEHFDNEIIPLINEQFEILSDIGVGSSEGFYIEDASSIWSDFMPEAKSVPKVIGFVYRGVKLAFDPPTQTAHHKAMQEQYDELKWRLNVHHDST